MKLPELGEHNFQFTKLYIVVPAESSCKRRHGELVEWEAKLPGMQDADMDLPTAVHPVQSVVVGCSCGAAVIPCYSFEEAQCFLGVLQNSLDEFLLSLISKFDAAARRGVETPLVAFTPDLG